jgi:hypothetical protein
MKSLGKIIVKAFCGLALVLLMAGCADILQSPAAAEAKPGTGKITLSVSGGPARTAVPLIGQFGKIILTIEGQNGAADLPDADAKSGSVSVVFPVTGTWKITAKAYLDAADENPAAASEPHDFSWNGTAVSGNTAFILVPAGNGPGTLKYTVTVPGDVTLAGGSRISIEQDGAALDGLDSDGFTDGVHGISASEAGIEVPLAAGTYAADILLVKNNNSYTAVYRETVVILPGLVTEISFTPDATSFLDPAVRAALTDITDTDLEFGGTALADGSIDIDDLEAGDPASPTLAIAAPAGTEGLYFTLAKTAEHSVAIGGTDAALVTMLADGVSVEGSSAGEEFAIFAVDTSGKAEMGGDIEFTLTVTKEGRIGVDVAVTVTVEAPQGGDGPGLYIDSGTGEVENLTAEAGFTHNGADTALLQAALDWLKDNAADNTKYVVQLNEDNEISAAWASKTGSTGVKITLRGLDEERDIYWEVVKNGALEQDNLFTINGGTTLVLGENIAVGPGSIYPSYEGDSPSSVPQTRDVFRVAANGAFEMLPDSKITGVKEYRLVNVQGAGAFTMRGGSIQDNQFSSHYSMSLVNMDNENPKFEMFAGAEIKNNTHPWAQSGISGAVTNNSSLQNIVFSSSVYSIISAVRITNGQFVMHGGSITNNDTRGLFLGYSEGTGTTVEFTMEGGEISGNGTGVFTCDSGSYYVWGAGIHAVGSFKITLTSGSIRDNGHANSIGGGMLLSNSNATMPVPMLLNGSVSFANNAILVQATGSFNNPVIYLGSSFGNPDGSPIALEAGYINTSTSHTASSVSTFLNGKEILLAPAENGADLAAAKDQFGLTRVFSARSTTFVVTDYNTTKVINDDGTLSVSVIP